MNVAVQHHLCICCLLMAVCLEAVFKQLQKDCVEMRPLVRSRPDQSCNYPFLGRAF